MFCLKTAADGCETPLPTVLGLPPQAVPSLRPLPAALIRKLTSQLLRIGAHTQNRCLIPAVRFTTGRNQKPEVSGTGRPVPLPRAFQTGQSCGQAGAPCAGYEPAHNGKVLSCIQQLTAHSASTSAGRSAARNPHGEAQSGALSAATGSSGHELLHQAAS